MMWADQVESRLRSQDDYFHDVGLFHYLLRFQIAHALWTLRHKGVLVAKRERYRGVHNGRIRQRSRMIYTVIGSATHASQAKRAGATRRSNAP
jgi:hypothetical protein